MCKKESGGRLVLKGSESGGRLVLKGHGRKWVVINVLVRKSYGALSDCIYDVVNIESDSVFRRDSIRPPHAGRIFFSVFCQTIAISIERWSMAEGSHSDHRRSDVGTE